MIDFRFNVDIDGVERAFHALADSIEDVTVPLLRTGGAIRSRARKLFQSEGNGKWPALSPATIKRKITSAEVALLRVGESGRSGQRSIVQRIVRDAAGAAQWSGRADAISDQIEKVRRKSVKTLSQTFSGIARVKRLEEKRGKALTQARTRIEKILSYRHLAKQASIEANELVAYARREVARSKAHGRVQRAVKQLQRAGYAMSDQERRSMLRQSARRYKASEASTRMLGGLEDTLGMKVDGATLAVYSKAFISGIHNEGGGAGHGAQIKKREFLSIEPGDLDIFVEAVQEAGITAWIEA